MKKDDFNVNWKIENGEIYQKVNLFWQFWTFLIALDQFLIDDFEIIDWTWTDCNQFCHNNLDSDDEFGSKKLIQTRFNHALSQILLKVDSIS